MLETITAKTGIDYLKEIRKSTKLTEKHYKIIEQQTTSTEDVILEKENWNMQRLLFDFLFQFIELRRGEKLAKRHVQGVAEFFDRRHFRAFAFRP